MEADQQQRAVGDLAGRFNHPWAGGGHERRRGRVADIALPGLDPIERHALASQQAADVQHSPTHGRKGGPGPPDIADGEVAGGTVRRTRSGAISSSEWASIK